MILIYCKGNVQCTFPVNRMDLLYMNASFVLYADVERLCFLFFSKAAYCSHLYLFKSVSLLCCQRFSFSLVITFTNTHGDASFSVRLSYIVHKIAGNRNAFHSIQTISIVLLHSIHRAFLLQFWSDNCYEFQNLTQPSSRAHLIFSRSYTMWFCIRPY